MKIECKYCGAYIDINKEIFCPNCGAELSIPKKFTTERNVDLQQRKRELHMELVQCAKVYENLLVELGEL